MSERVIERRIQHLQWVHGVGLAACLALIAIATAITRDSDVDTVPVWFALLIVAVAGVPIAFTVRYYRRRPLEREGNRDYTITVLFRVGIALMPAVVAIVLAGISGSLLPQLLGSAISLVLLAWTVPSEGDYRRHRALAEEVGPIPPDEKWGEAGPDEVAPWDDEHGGHGHGLTH